MSDEPTPTPSLRLKPRLRPPEAASTPTPAAEPPASVPPEAAPAAPVGSVFEPASPAAASAEPAPRIRLKPRLSSDSPAAASQPSPATPEEQPRIPDAVIPAIIAPDPQATIPPTVPPRPAPLTFPPVGSPPPAAPSAPGARATVPPLFLPPETVPQPASTIPPTPATTTNPSPVADTAVDAKIKFKPKAPPPPAVILDALPPPAVVPPTVPAPAAAPVSPPAGVVPTVPAQAAGVPPRFPVVASTEAPKPRLTLAVPHVQVSKEPPPPTAAELAPKPSRKGAVLGLAAAAVIVLGAAGYFGWRTFMAEPPPPPKPPARAPAAAKPAPAPAPSASAPTAQPEASAPAPASAQPATPSATLNSLAHVPANSIRKAETTAAAHGGVVQQTNAVVESDAPPEPAKPAARPAPTASTELAPGVSTTTQVNAAAEASPAFRTFVANARVSGVVRGPSPKALINGRLIRAGEVVDSGLGIVFDGVNGNQLVFKDRSGATVSRRY